MRWARVIMATIGGAILPFAIAMVDAVPFLNHHTPYEVVLEWMVATAGLAGVATALLTRR